MTTASKTKTTVPLPLRELGEEFRTDARDVGEIDITKSTTPDSQVLVRHPVWCEESESEQRTYRVIDEDKNTFELVGGMEVDGRHVGRLRSLDCGEHFSWTVQVQLEQLYDEHEASPASIRLHCLDNDFVGNGTTAHLTVPEAERVIAMLQKAIRGMDLNARSEQQVSRG